MVDLFSGCKDAQSAMGQWQKYGYNMEISAAYVQPLLLYNEN